MVGLLRRQWREKTEEFVPGQVGLESLDPAPSSNWQQPQVLEMQAFLHSGFYLATMVLLPSLVKDTSPTKHIYLFSYGRGEEGMEERLNQKGYERAGVRPSLWEPRIEVAVDSETQVQ